MLKTKRFLRKIHLWLGLISGIIVFIISLTGSIYVFAKEIKEMVYEDHETIEVPKNGKRLNIERLVEVAEKTFDKQYSFRNIGIPNETNKAVNISFYKSDEAGLGYHNYVKFNKTVYINPYTGKVIHIENSKWEFFSIILAIHMNLFLGHNDLSVWIIVVSVWIFVFSLITGIIIWWPKKKQRKEAFALKIKKSHKWRRKNYQLHRVLGFYAAFIGLGCALTGLMWASKSFNNSVKWVANGGEVIKQKELPKSKSDLKLTEPLQAIYEQTLIRYPETKYMLIRKHPKPQLPYIVRSYVDENWNFVRKEMYYHKESAELLAKLEFSDKNNGEKIQAINYDLHVGSIGGLPLRIIYFFASLIMASLPVTGFLIWWGRRNK